MNEPEKYGFHPKALLNSLTDIYLHLDSQEFAQAVGNDEVLVCACFMYLVINFLSLQRSYNKDVFDACISLMVKNQIKPMDQIGQFREFADRVEKEAAAALMEDIGYGEVPAEFKGQ